MNHSISFNNLSFYTSAQNSSRFMNQGMGISQMGTLNPTGTLSQTAPVNQPEAGKLNLPGQPDTKEATDGRKIPGQPDLDTYECQTCKNRTYQDGSDDPCVSFKSPTKISPEKAAYAIRSHEAEHVAHAWSEAQEEDKEIVSQSVSYHTDICPECGRTYMSGGTTRTVFRSAPETYSEEPAQKGAYVDLVA